MIVCNVRIQIDFSFKNLENSYGFKIEDYISAAQSDQGKSLEEFIRYHSTLVLFEESINEFMKVNVLILSRGNNINC